MKENQDIEWKSSWQDEWLKWICGFANSNGGTLYVGYNDKGEVIGINNSEKLAKDIPNKVKSQLGVIIELTILEEHGKDCLKIVVESYPFPISYHGRYYLRSGGTNKEIESMELDKFILKKLGRTWDGNPYPNITIDNLDKEAIKIFRKESLDSERLSEKDLNVDDRILLEKLQLYENGYLTIAGTLLFHKNPEYYFTGSTIKIGFFEKNDADLRYQDEIGGALITQVDNAIDLVYTKYLKALIWYDDIHRREEFMFPKEAFREILLNAVNHKDYSSGVPIQISVYEDKIYVANIGLFPKSIDITKIYEKHISKPFNPKIAGTFFKAGYIESWGRGFEKIKEECNKNNIPLPIIDIKGESIIIKCLPSKKYSELNQNEPNNEPNNELKNKQTMRRENIVEIIRNNSNVTISQLTIIIGVSRETIKRDIGLLIKQNKIKKIGKTKNSRLEIV